MPFMMYVILDFSTHQLRHVLHRAQRTLEEDHDVIAYLFDIGAPDIGPDEHSHDEL